MRQAVDLMAYLISCQFHVKKCVDKKLYIVVYILYMLYISQQSECITAFHFIVTTYWFQLYVLGWSIVLFWQNYPLSITVLKYQHSTYRGKEWISLSLEIWLLMTFPIYERVTNQVLYWYLECFNTIKAVSVLQRHLQLSWHLINKLSAWIPAVNLLQQMFTLRSGIC